MQKNRIISRALDSGLNFGAVRHSQVIVMTIGCACPLNVKLQLTADDDIYSLSLKKNTTTLEQYHIKLS